MNAKSLAKILLGIVITSTTIPSDGPVYWAIFGPVDVSTMTPYVPPVVSTGPSTFVVLKSSTSTDCYSLAVTPNGTLKTVWVKCP